MVGWLLGFGCDATPPSTYDGEVDLFARRSGTSSLIGIGSVPPVIDCLVDVTLDLTLVDARYQGRPFAVRDRA